MPAPSRDKLDEALATIKRLSSVTKAAIVLNMPRTTLSEWVQTAKAMGIYEKPETNELQAINDNLRRELDIAREALQNATKPRYTIRQDIAGESDELLVIAMGDAHDDPTIPDKSRFYQAGRYVRDLKPDVFVSIGDFLNMNSLCFHIPNENYSGKAKPTFLTDIASGREAFAALNDGMGSCKPEKHKKKGNHEHRIDRIEDQAPESYGMYTSLYDEMMVNAGFTYSPYGSTSFYGGVGFTHIALSIMGKPVGGKDVLNAMGRDSVYDTVTGHTHSPGKKITRKIGGRHITSVDTGCFLPYGHIEDFAQHTYGGWDWGLTELRIKNRQIVGYKWISLLELQERYGHG